MGQKTDITGTFWPVGLYTQSGMFSNFDPVNKTSYVSGTVVNKPIIDGNI